MGPEVVEREPLGGMEARAFRVLCGSELRRRARRLPPGYPGEERSKRGAIAERRGRTPTTLGVGGEAVVSRRDSASQICFVQKRIQYFLVSDIYQQKFGVRSQSAEVEHPSINEESDYPTSCPVFCKLIERGAARIRR